MKAHKRLMAALAEPNRRAAAYQQQVIEVREWLESEWRVHCRQHPVSTGLIPITDYQPPRGTYTP